MTLIELVEAGGPGSGCHGPHCGRKPTGKTAVSKKGQVVSKVKSDLAKRDAVLVTRDTQRKAESMESVIASHLGGHTFHDSEPVDIVVKNKKGKTLGIEVKTILLKRPDNARARSGRAEQITMTHGAIPRKLAWAKENKADLHTLVIDLRDGGLTLYHANGVGSFSFGTPTATLQPVPGNFAGLKKLLGV